MSTLLAQFHFLRPWWFVLAIVWLPVLVWRMRAVRRGAVLGRLADAVLLPYLLVGTRRARYGSWLLAFVAASLATLALAGPTWQRLPQPLYAGGAAQVVVVSLSQRMLARDIKPDRMRRVRFKVHDLLHANAAGRNGLVAYAGAAFTVAPLTTDAHALDDLLDALRPDVMPVAGDAPAKGIARGVTLLQHAGVHGGSLVLVTDTVDASAIAAARQARDAGVRVSVLGVGTTAGTPVPMGDGSLLTNAAGTIVMARRDDASLRALATAGGGIYVPMRADHADIKALTAELGRSHSASEPALARGDQWRDMGPWLLLPLLLLAAASFRRGWLLVIPLVVFPFATTPAYAMDSVPARAASVTVAPPAQPVAGPIAPHGGWSALWHNADQRAARALANGHAKQAEALAHAPAWRGAAAYRAGNFAAAANAYATASGPDAAYNLGNALAKQGRYREAIKAYDKALERDPGNADAKANRDAVRDWLRKHKSASSKSKRGQNGQRGSHQQRRNGKQGNASSSNGKSAGQQPSSAASSGAPASATSSRSAGHGRSSKPNASGKDSSGRAGPPAPEQKSGEASRSAGARNGRSGEGTPAFDLGQAPARASSIAPLPQSMQRALERVPDDPGGLLRRKFLLEYQTRQHGADTGGGA